MLASAIAIPLAGSITHSHAASASSQASWSIVPSPNGNNSSGNAIQSLSVVSSNNIWALGFYDDTSNNLQQLIEHYDGTSWNLATPPALSSGSLSSISAVSSNDIWVVGNSADPNTGTKSTLTMHFDGTNWSTIPSPNLSSDGDNVLNSVKAISSNDVWTVGYSGHHALTLHWDGTSWTSVPNPDPPTGIGSYGNALTLVTAISSNDIWASGYTWHSESLGSYHTIMLEHWDGTSWTTKYNSLLGGFAGNDDTLYSISATSSNDVWAAGVNYNSSYPLGSQGPLIMHYDGTNWNIVVDQSSSFDPNTPNSLYAIPNSISADSSNDVWAVGWGNTPTYTAILHYDGTSWTAAPGPDLASLGNDNGTLYAVSAISSNNVWAAGSSNGKTLIEHYAPSTPPAPSGTWISPSDGFSVQAGSSLQLGANASPAQANSAIQHVDFAVNWNGAWHTICTTISSSNTFGCNWNLEANGSPVPIGAIQLQFTVYDSSGTTFLSPTLQGTITPQPVAVQKVWTADGNNNTQTTFTPGDTIQYEAQVNNPNSATVTASFTFVATGPQQIFSWSGSQSVSSGSSIITQASTVPSTAPAGTYTLNVTVTYNGVSSQGQALFTIINRYAVSVNVTPPSGIIGVSASMDIWKPYLQSGDIQTLAQIAALDTQTILGYPVIFHDIELGWMVTPYAYGGGPDPKLFVFVRDSWKYGKDGCLVQKTSTGWSCGFKQLDTTNYPGKDLLSGVGKVKKFSIVYSSGNWFILYDGNRIGYIPESAFSFTFNKVTTANWQGEVLVASTPPTTQMGNGNCGTSTSSQNVPAHFYTMAIESPTQAYPAYTYSQTYFATDKKFYNGAYNYTKNTKTTLTYGGPSGCP